LKILPPFYFVLLIVSLFASLFISYSLVTGQSSYKIEGYIKDASGVPIAEAYLIFNNFSIPSIQTNQQGYYSLNAPAGTYRLDVFPPNDSRFINYWESYNINKAETKNITLFTGYKISGYVVNASGSPMVGAAVLLKLNNTVIYGSGFFTNQEGYYYVNAPPGTYTIDAHPQTAYDPHYQWECTYFKTYTETGFVISGDLTRNITVNLTPPTPTPTPTTTPTPTQQPTATPKPTPESQATPQPTATASPTLKPTATPTPTTTPDQITINSPTPDSSMDAIVLSTPPTQTSSAFTSKDAGILVTIGVAVVVGCLMGLLLYGWKRKKLSTKTASQ
jgi:cell division septation protein DedD